MATSRESQQGNSYLVDYVEVDELTAAISPPTRIVLVIRAEDGELENVHAFGGKVESGHNPEVGPAGAWYWKDNCVYVDHNGTWKKVCAPHRMILQILVENGKLEKVVGPVQSASDPGVPPKGHWYWKTSSPACVYVNHFGGWKRVCNLTV